MLYKSFQEQKLSALGMGNMRLPTLGKGGPIDREKAREIIEYTYENGVNYFDTAYRYHGGESETFVGEVLSQYPRDSFCLASKMPGHMMSYRDGHLGFVGYLAGHKDATVSDIFEEQLEKCRVDYFDFYLLHNVYEGSFDFYCNEELGVIPYLLEQKRKGRIRHLGFSSHGSAETIEKFLNRWDCFEFAQIQLNYLDWRLQSADRKYALLQKRGLPILVMEPCRGGRLTSLGKEADRRLLQARPQASVASWAFRFLQSLPGVQLVLSGMSTLEQARENVLTFSDDAYLSDSEKELLMSCVASLYSLIPCTGCRYCCEECPQKLEIPSLISLYNEICSEPSGSVAMAVQAMKPEEAPSRCLRCGACRSVCPQGIDVPALLQRLAEAIVQYQ